MSVKNEAGIKSPKMFTAYVDENKKNPQYVHFRCGRVHINKSFKKTGESYKLQPSVLKQEKVHDEIYEDTREEKKNEWLPYIKDEVLSTAFCHARFTMGL